MTGFKKSWQAPDLNNGINPNNQLLSIEELTNNDTFIDHQAAHFTDRGKAERVILKLVGPLFETNTQLLAQLLDRLILIQNPKNEVIAAGDSPIDQWLVNQLIKMKSEVIVLGPERLIVLMKEREHLN